MEARGLDVPALFGVEASLKKAEALVQSAFASLDDFGSRADVLKALALGARAESLERRHR